MAKLAEVMAVSDYYNVPKKIAEARIDAGVIESKELERIVYWYECKRQEECHGEIIEVDFTEELVENINAKYAELNKVDTFEYKTDLDLKVMRSLDGPRVFTKNWNVCKVADLTQMIEELTLMKKAIEGIYGRI